MTSSSNKLPSHQFSSLLPFKFVTSELSDPRPSLKIVRGSRLLMLPLTFKSLVHDNFSDYYYLCHHFHTGIACLKFQVTSIWTVFQYHLSREMAPLVVKTRKSAESSIQEISKGPPPHIYKDTSFYINKTTNISWFDIYL